MPLNFDHIFYHPLILSTRYPQNPVLSSGGIETSGDSKEKESDSDEVIEETPLPGNKHMFLRLFERSFICHGCQSCSSFGSSCVKFQYYRQQHEKSSVYSLSKGSEDEDNESSDNDQESTEGFCNCGFGPSGCSRCNLCLVCCNRDTSCSSQANTSSGSARPGAAILGIGRWKVGARVEVQWRKFGGSLYPGTISRSNDDGTYNILYDDGDKDTAVVSARVALLSPSKNMSQSANIASGLDAFPQPLLLDYLFPSSSNQHKPERSPSTSSSHSEEGHPGTMICRCGHQLGAVEYPLASGYYHLSGRCLWVCCGGNWDERRCVRRDDERATGRPGRAGQTVSCLSRQEVIDHLTRQHAPRLLPTDSWCRSVDDLDSLILVKASDELTGGKKRVEGSDDSGGAPHPGLLTRPGRWRGLDELTWRWRASLVDNDNK